MRVVTIVSLGASAVLGLAALFVAKTVLPNAAAAKNDGEQTTASAPVVVAKAGLKFGDKLDASKVAVLRFPADAVPEGAFSTVAQVLAQDNGAPPVVLTTVAAREPLLPSKLSGPGARASVAAEIADGMRAYTIKVSDVTGVGGHALPGDRVDVVLQRDLTPSGDTRTFVSEVVLQNVRVLGVDLNADLSANKPASPSTATLEVTVEDAQKLSVAADLGKLSLALRKTGAAEIAPVTPMLTRNVVTMGAGGGAVRSAPVASGSGGYRRPAASGGSSLIMIVEGDGRRGGARRAPAPRPAPAAPAASASAKPADA